MKNNEYTSPLGITSQFYFCGNPFRLDVYKGCTVGCKYCFINNQHSNNVKNNGQDRRKIVTAADVKKIENRFCASVIKPKGLKHMRKPTGFSLRSYHLLSLARRH